MVRGAAAGVRAGVVVGRRGSRGSGTVAACGGGVRLCRLKSPLPEASCARVTIRWRKERKTKRSGILVSSMMATKSQAETKLSVLAGVVKRAFCLGRSECAYTAFPRLVCHRGLLQGLSLSGLLTVEACEAAGRRGAVGALPGVGRRARAGAGR